MKWLIALYGSALLLLYGIGTGAAQDIGMGAGVSLAKANDHAGAATGFEARASFFGDNNLAILASGGRYVADAQGSELKPGTYALLWAEATLLAQVRIKILQPYAGIGCGYYMPHHDISQTAQNPYAALGQKIEQNIQNMAAAHLRGGLYVIVSPLVSMYVDVKYIFFKPDVKTEIKNKNTGAAVSTGKQNIDLSTMFVGVGVGLGM
jgi:outer membrane protein W